MSLLLDRYHGPVTRRVLQLTHIRESNLPHGPVHVQGEVVVQVGLGGAESL